MKDYNSITNQNIKTKFVEREVYCCLTDMVGELIEAEKLDIYDHLEYYGEDKTGNEYTEAERDEKLEELNEELEALQKYPKSAKKKIAELEERIAELESMEFDRLPEIYEYWGVSNFLGDKLKAQGQVVITDYMVSIWGRQTSGQAILLDACISKICEEMEILEGQENDWSK